MVFGFEKTRFAILGTALFAWLAIGCEWDPGVPDGGQQTGSESKLGLPTIDFEGAASRARTDIGGQSKAVIAETDKTGPPGAASSADARRLDSLGPAVEFAFAHVDPEPADHLARAKALWEDEDNAGAMLELEKGLYDDPTSYPAAFLLGVVAKSSKRVDLAVDAFMLAAQIEPEEDDPWVELARISIDGKKFDEAEQLALRALQFDSKRALTHNLLGRVWLSRSHWDRAIRRFKKALELSPDNSYYRNNLGFALVLKRDFSGAVETLEPLAEKEGLPAFMYNNLGLAYEGAGQLQESTVMFRKAIAAQPRYVNAQINLERLVRVAKRIDQPPTEEMDDLEDVIEDEDLILPESDDL